VSDEGGQSTPAPDSGARRRIFEAAAVAVLVAAVHIAFRLSGSFLTGALNDDGVYVVLGKAIAQGEGYRSIHLVGAPIHVRYPPGFPLLLAIPWALGGSLDAVRATVAVTNVAATAIAAGLVWWVGREHLRLGRWPLAVCAATPFVLDGTIQYFNIPLTEPYLVLGWAAALVLSQPLFDGPATAAGSVVARAALVGLLLAGTTLFRAAGIALVPAVLLALALHRRWRAAAACAVGGVVPLAAWAMLRAAWAARGFVSDAPDDLGYWHWLGVDGPVALAGYAGRTLAANAAEYTSLLASQLLSIWPIGIGIVGLASVAVVVASARLWRAHTALVTTTLAASALTLLWPFAQDRLMLPLLPFLGLLAAESVGRVVADRPAWVVWEVVALGAVALAVTLRQFDLRDAANRGYRTSQVPVRDQSAALILAARTRFMAATIDWVNRRTAPQDRIMVDAPAAVYLYTSRHTVPGQPTESRLAASVFERPGRYLAERILADSITVVIWGPPAFEFQRDILAVAARCPGVLEPVASARSMYFRVARDETCLRRSVLQDEAP
jgi:hypothetical protein